MALFCRIALFGCLVTMFGCGEPSKEAAPSANPATKPPGAAAAGAAPVGEMTAPSSVGAAAD